MLQKLLVRHVAKTITNVDLISLCQKIKYKYGINYIKYNI